jgi:integrase
MPPDYSTDALAGQRDNRHLAGILPYLRHTMATILLESDVHPKKVQERLGHSKIAITMDTYSHVLPSMQQDVARKLDDLLKE